MATVVRIETQTAINHTQLTKARQNALFGFQVALGSLQKEMGPDQRVSAPASVFKKENDSTTLQLADDDPRRFWIGVWDTENLNATDPSDPLWQDKMTWMNNPNERHLSWLVSGLDSDAQQVPDINLNLAQGEPIDEDVALLVGGNSVGADHEDRFVMAPKVPIIADGQSGTTSNGNYAYWIADEGQKAPLNLVDDRYSDPTQADPSDSMTSRYSLTAPERVGVNALDNWQGYDLTVPDLAKDFARLMSYQDISHVDGEYLPNTPDAWHDLLQENFHDLNMGSIILQTDVLNGGLKKDLNLLFELDDDDFETTPYGGDESTREDKPPTDGSSYIDAFTGTQVSYLFKHPAPAVASNAFIRGPTWHFLRSYYNLYKKVDDVEENPTIPAQPYRPNTVDFNAVNEEGKEGRFSGLVNVMNYRYNGDVKSGNNNVNTRVDPPDEDEVDVPRLTQHEVAPIAVRLFLVFGFAQTTPSEQVRIKRDKYGNPVTANSWNYELDVTGPEEINALIIQPIAVVWNPYNTSISFNAYKVSWEKPTMSFELSWPEPLPNGSAYRSFLAPLEFMLGASNPAYDNHGNQVNDFYSYLEFLIGNGPDGSEPTVLKPGELKIFSPQDQHHLGYVMKQGGALFLEEGWHESGGLLIYRTAETTRADKYKNPDTGVDQYSQIDNIPSSYPITIERVYWTNQNGAKLNNSTKTMNFSSSIENIGFGDYLLTDTESIAEGGNRENDDYELRSIGASFSDPDGVQEVFDSGINGLQISPTAIAFSGGVYPFMAVEVRLNPANSTDGSPMEMLGNTNPFAPLGPAFQGGSLTPDRNQVFVHPMSGSPSYNTIRPESTLNSDGNVYFGYNYSASDGSTRAVLQEIPTTPLWSLGSLQHANISLSAYLPRNAIGNSQASPYFETSDTTLQKQIGTSGFTPSLYDISFLSNESLFDSFFFSSIAPDTDQDTVPEHLQLEYNEAISESRPPRTPNERFTYIDSLKDYGGMVQDLSKTDGYLKTAAYFAPKGGFNVNSTSVDAWKAFLSSNLDREFSYYDGDDIITETAVGALYSRFALPISKGGDDSSGPDDWSEPLQLDDQAIDALANAIVTEVKNRGPFLSIGDFINRRPGSTQAEHQLNGALSRAIEQSGINDTIRAQGDDAYTGSDVNSAYKGANTLGNTAAGIPGWLTQADLLTPLAPYMSVRSDTFTVRSYGEVTNPLTNEITARAWCEATVQRLPEFVEDTNDPWDSPNEYSEQNKNFGRRFVVVSFRWLDQDDI